MKVLGRKVIVLNDPDYGPDLECSMQFRLTYDGPLFATQRDPLKGQPDKKANHKHEIRQAFHPQLKRLWETVPFLKSGPHGPQYLTFNKFDGPLGRDELAQRHALYGWNFVPLVTDQNRLLCGLDILFLRPDLPGQILQSGDIDNRLKTLFDALRVPVAGEDYHLRTATDDEKPLFCLLEEDRLITKIAVEADQVLQIPSGKDSISFVRIIITVTVKPTETNLANIHFS